MSNRIDTKIVLGEKRFKSAINVDSSVPISLENNRKEMDEFDRSSVISLNQVFNDERNACNIFRLTANIDFIFFNAYDGISNYSNFQNQLYYTDPNVSFSSNTWSGYPQYQEFDLSRIDNKTPEYTIDPNSHILFNNKDASFYNWNFYVTYPYLNDYKKRIKAYVTNTISIDYLVEEGIVAYIVNPNTSNGQTLISFAFPIKHNAKVGQYIEIKMNGIISREEIYSLGAEGYGSEEYVINVFSTKQISNKYINGNLCLIKRIADINNPIESKSQYYVRKHRVISSYNDAILNKAGFEQNGFGVKRKFEFSSLTPNNVSRISELHSNQSYLLSFKKDFDISNYRDNLNRPLTELYITTINRGRFGWFNKPIQNDVGYREGFEFNMVGRSTALNKYWDQSNNYVNLGSVKTNSFNRGPFNFYYNRFLNIGDDINGSYCEFNSYEQKEYVLSEIYHKIYFNDQVFQIKIDDNNNPPGYYYKPHYPITLRVYSDYIEEGSVDDIAGVPDYAYYSTSKKALIWRDIYTYGYVDDEGRGVDYPFLNGAHYPTSKIIFNLKPEGYVRQNITTVARPKIDECE